MKQLWPFQEEALASVLPLSGRPLIVLPTGAGKSLINAHLAANNFTGRTLCLTHAQELVEQNEAELRELLPDASIGVFCAALGRKEADCNIVVGSVGSVHRNPHLFEGVTQIIIDEAHRVSIFRAKMYRAVLEHFDGVPVCGLTATPYRLGTGLLHTGPEAFFDRIAHEVRVRDLIDGGYLAPLVSKSPKRAQLPTGKLKMRGGEYTGASLAEMAAEAPLTHAALRDALVRAEGRRHILVFACNVDHAKLIVSYLNAHGETAALLAGESSREQRIGGMAAFRKGYVRWLVNVNVLTTGFNFPALDCIAVLRPTASPVVYVQINGRGTRTWLHKPDCLILDYGGNVARHGMFDDPSCGSEQRTAVITCEKCDTCYPKPHTNCPECGNPTPKCEQLKPKIKCRGKESSKIEETPFEAPILSDGSQWRQVRSWAWRQHTSKAGNRCLLVRYRCSDGTVINEFLVEGSHNFNHFLSNIFSAFPKIPGDIESACAAISYCKKPTLILAKRQDDNPDYWRILKREMDTL